jgi:hypothetical protein
MPNVWTINKFYNEFKSIAQEHKEIESFGYGEEFDINNQPQSNAKFPQLWVQHVNTQIVLGRNTGQDQRRFVLFCYDLPRQDDENYLSVWNQTELILIDVCRIFNYRSSDYKLVNNPIITPFEEKGADNVVGCFCEIVVSTAEITGYCQIPGID